MSTDSARTSRLEARLPQSVLELIRTAAELEGRSLSDFVVGSARDAAIQSIETHSALKLALDDQLKFARALIAPRKPTTAMRKAAERHRKLIESENDN